MKFNIKKILKFTLMSVLLGGVVQASSPGECEFQCYNQEGYPSFNAELFLDQESLYNFRLTSSRYPVIYEKSLAMSWNPRTEIMSFYNQGLSAEEPMGFFIKLKINEKVYQGPHDGYVNLVGSSLPLPIRCFRPVDHD